ncbi:hypothetical protein HPP92_023072 [Vanilla planifolia]|uniref:Uncharacterized protein n=1 Tax=Vanilla planifolia TaxID=51239 RepID=A0A835PYN5_VANPL|nr:hypothetical protein HPP92_023072 [Vanilla planifolia]
MTAPREDEHDCGGGEELRRLRDRGIRRSLRLAGYREEDQSARWSGLVICQGYGKRRVAMTGYAGNWYGRHQWRWAKSDWEKFGLLAVGVLWDLLLFS